MNPLEIMMPVKAIPLNHGKTAIIDPEDWPLVKNYKWSASPSIGTRSSRISNWYVQGSCGSRESRTTMHRLLMNPGPLEVDHINGNGLDNRRFNMENVTSAENKRRSRIRKCIIDSK